MSIPKPSNDNGGGGTSAPFLKANHLPKKGKVSITFTGGPTRLSEGTFGTQIFVPVKLGSKDFTFAIKLNSGNHTRLFDRFGSNDRKWKGKVLVQRAEFAGNDYVQVAD